MTVRDDINVIRESWRAAHAAGMPMGEPPMEEVLNLIETALIDLKRIADALERSLK